MPIKTQKDDADPDRRRQVNVRGRGAVASHDRSGSWKKRVGKLRLEA